jgi:MtrB/PioB family decaheme-associated outer membrane protein
MRRRLIALLVAELFVVAPPAAAGEESGWSGSAGLGLRLVNDKAKDTSKLNEYRDLDDGVFGIFDLRFRSDSYYLNAFGENIGQRDWYVDFWGGKYNDFKYQIYGNNLRHNFGSGAGALSPYNGIGTSTLTAVFPSLNTGTWNSFDNSYDRQDIGAMFEISKGSPWYLRVDGNQVKRDGIKVIAGAQGTSPGNGFVDLPSPVDFKTDNISVEGGYQTKTQQYALSYSYSKFTNENPLLNWSNGFFSSAQPLRLDTTVLPADNEFWRIGANATWKKLPYESTLAARLTYGKVTSDVSVLSNTLGGNTNVTPNLPANNGSFPATNANSPLFHGEEVIKTASLSLTSRPDAKADTRIYWNWSEKQNESTQMTFSPAFGSGLVSGAAGDNCATVGVRAIPCTPELFSYRKNNFGLEGSYRVNPANKLTAGYDYLFTWRERIDFDETKDNKFYAEWKNSSLDEVTARIKYQYLDRNSTYVGSTSPTVIDSFVRRFDLANVNQNQVKLVLDANPAPLWDLGFEAIYKKNDYKDTLLGRTDDQRQEYYASIAWGDMKSLRIMVFGDIEFLEYNSLHRFGAGNANPAAPPEPAPPAVSSTYTWSAKNKDKSWQIGLGADWLPAERWKLNASLIYAETNGTTDFATQAGTVLAAPLLPIGNSDNTRRTALVLKGNYKLDKNWTLTGGYSFERYRFNDIGYDGFTYTVGTGTSTAYLSGQSAFQDYTANIFYFVSTYKF